MWYDTEVTADVCLIIPPSPFLLDERVFPSLGILRVAASLEAQGASVDLLDLSGVQNHLEVLELYLKQNATTRFGLTATTPQYPQAHAISRRIYEVKPEAVTVIGGPHPTLVNAAARTERKNGKYGRGEKALLKLTEDFDLVVAGDGDLLRFEELFEARDWTQGAVIDADDPKSNLFMTDAVYEKTPLPARHLIDMDSYRYTIEGHKSTSLIAQLGCPFQCGFCGGRLSPMLRRIRTRSTESIIDEVRMLHLKHGYTGFMFYDDEMNVSKSMIELMEALTRLQDEVKTEFRLRGFVKAELFNQEQASAMYRAGFRWLLTGFESGSPRILENINKRATQDENTRAADIAHDNGLKVKALMSIGHPGESHETIEETREWLLEVRPEDFDVTIITTYPGSPYYDAAVPSSEPGFWTYTAKSGDRLHAYELDYSVTADYYKGDPNGGYKAYVFTDHLTSDELVSERDRLEREVRTTLKIPFNQSAASINYEHSMGQGLPESILRTSKGDAPREKTVVRLPVIK